MTERTWTEAPASVNLKCRYLGYDVMITLRGETGGEVLPKLETAVEWLEGHGAAPADFGNGNGNGTDSADSDGPTICPIHHVAMKRREKNGDIWYSHKAHDASTGQEYWCRGGQE